MWQTLVTGCGRSGTGSMARHLNLGHETLRAEGISSWYLAGHYDRAKAKMVRLPKWHSTVPEDWWPDRVIHVTRSPLACISSVQTLRPESWAYVRSHLGKPPEHTNSRAATIGMCAWYWMHWNRLAEGWGRRVRYERMRIEDVPIGVHNSRVGQYEPISIAALKRACSPWLWAELDLLSEAYGYGPLQ